MTEITPEMIEAGFRALYKNRGAYIQPQDKANCLAKVERLLTAALAAAPAPQPVAWLKWGVSKPTGECYDIVFADVGQQGYRALYEAPPAPPAEIDRLKAENERLRNLVEKLDGEAKDESLWRFWNNKAIELQEKVDQLRATVTKRDVNYGEERIARDAAEARIAELEASEKRMREALEKSKKLRSDKAKAIEALKAIKAGKEYDAYWIAEAALIGLGVIEGDK